MMPEERQSEKNCPDCGQPLTPRTDAGGAEMLGCSNWPDCHYTEPIPQDVLLRRQNHPTIPGF